MQDANSETETPAPQANPLAEKRSTDLRGTGSPNNQRRFRSLPFAAAMSVVGVTLLSARQPLLHSVVAAQTRDGAAPTVQSVASGQLLQIELRSSVQAAVDDLRQQSSISPRAITSGKDDVETAKPVVTFQGSTCVDPHPGSPSQSQQPIDQCHTQVWYKYADGCTGYRIVATPGGGANCGNQQSMSENITWTFCAAKHSR